MNVARFTIGTRHWGEVLILRPYPKPEETWGDLAPLKGTAFEGLIPIVSGTNLSHALHGLATPLMREIGPDPRGLLRMVPREHRACREARSCLMVSRHCTPGPKLPDCFRPVGIDVEALPAAATVLSAWAEGRHVLIVEGAEFSF